MKGNYGLDGPDYIFGFFILGIGTVIVSLLPSSSEIMILRNQTLMAWFAILNFLVGFGMLYTSKLGKILLAKQLVRKLNLKGDERILDVGCGRGLYLIEISRFLKNGRAYGLDIWQKRDQSGNKKETTLQNAKKEGVANRVEIVDGDMRCMPFDSNRFDLVISSIAVHNVPQKSGKECALKEMARVTKPGGLITVIDFKSVPFYGSVLRDLGWKDVQISKLTFLVFPPYRILQARKPLE